eukprot:bmy_19263T0
MSYSFFRFKNSCFSRTSKYLSPEPPRSKGNTQKTNITNTIYHHRCLYLTYYETSYTNYDGVYDSVLLLKNGFHGNGKTFPNYIFDIDPKADPFNYHLFLYITVY